jgi:hypothetical protein
VLTAKSYSVFERRKPAGVESGDLIEARLILTADDKLMFSPAFCFHPREAKRQIMKLVNQHKKRGLPAQELVFRLAYLRLKVDRYKHVTADKIYEDAFKLAS